VGGRPYLLELSGNNSLALASWRRHVEMLRRDSTLRRMIICRSRRSPPLPTMPPRTPRRLWIRAEKLLLNVTNGRATSSYQPIGATVMERPV
jgi:replicative DNA helicase